MGLWRNIGVNLINIFIVLGVIKFFMLMIYF